jgi:thioredoxin
MAIITCSCCGTKNRVDESAAQTKQPVCGKCGSKLSLGMRDGKPLEVTDSTLGALLNDAGDRPILVDAWAAWCGPCRMIAPTIDQLAAESNGRWLVAKLDVDSNPQTAMQYQIDSIPALLLFKNGKLVEKMVGLQPKQAIESRLSSV